MRIHVVQKDETFNTIAQKYGISSEELIEMNRHLDHSNELVPKMKVKVPLDKKEEKQMTQPSIDVTNKRMTPPHNPNRPKVLPRVKEDEFVLTDKLITSMEDDQDNEFIQQFLPDDFQGWVPVDPQPTQMYPYHYPVQTTMPFQYDQRQFMANAYNPYANMNPYPYGYTDPNYFYRPYNPCGCGGYYY
ncbi:LysM peptidoglycan-binding domain-containing protein [Piscibacillus salipiscarius]|uniref:LysM peptidoglycan-binding domain-containing protein n=1 Tax=Piscibacillus salipiscarius TaxID=299480 RepID=A0ABW5Q6W5_9BACI|nr:LysM peptidoglycan-binding domain-containing protein [Piscibacillus salipiscarius]